MGALLNTDPATAHLCGQRLLSILPPPNTNVGHDASKVPRDRLQERFSLGGNTSPGGPVTS